MRAAIRNYFVSLSLVISLVCKLCKNARAAPWIENVACDKLGTDGERAGRQELRKGVVSTKSGGALWSYSRPQ